MTVHTSTNLKVENGTATLTETTYDEDDRPLEGVTRTLTEQEAEDYMADKPQTSKATTPIDNNTVTEEELQNQNNTGQAPGHEKPASQMTEADAVALNSDVHVATPQTSPRIVTDGQQDQVDAGLHPDATEGKPLLTEK